MIKRRSGSRTARDRGAALILVVWAVGLMAVIGALIARDAHLDALEGNRLRDALAGQMLVQSGQRMALARLAQRANELSSGFPIVCDLQGGRVVINARPITGFVDINAAQEDTLAALFGALGVSGPDAMSYAARIADYRDGDTAIRAGGAEAPNYARAGLSYGPANRPFTRTGELSEVLGLPPALLSAVQPHVTTHSYSVQIDPRFAAPEVLVALEVFGSRAGMSLEGDAWPLNTDGAAPLFAGVPVVIEVSAKTSSGFVTGTAATYGPQESLLPASRRLLEERATNPEPVLAAGTSLPHPEPCY